MAVEIDLKRKFWREDDNQVKKEMIIYDWVVKYINNVFILESGAVGERGERRVDNKKLPKEVRRWLRRYPHMIPIKVQV